MLGGYRVLLPGKNTVATLGSRLCKKVFGFVKRNLRMSTTRLLEYGHWEKNAGTDRYEKLLKYESVFRRK